MKRYRVLVCGTAYGQVYLSTFLKRNSCFQLAGILGKGSERTKRFAQEFGVPWYSSVNELPNGIDIACVAIRSTIAGGQGTMIAKELLKKGIHVIQEHPVHSGDIQNCLKVAKENCVYYQVNSHYVHVKPVTMFIDYFASIIQIYRVSLHRGHYRPTDNLFYAGYFGESLREAFPMYLFSDRAFGRVGERCSLSGDTGHSCGNTKLFPHTKLLPMANNEK